MPSPPPRKVARFYGFSPPVVQGTGPSSSLRVIIVFFANATGPDAAAFCSSCGGVGVGDGDGSLRSGHLVRREGKALGQAQRRELCEKESVLKRLVALAATPLGPGRGGTLPLPNTLTLGT